MSEAYTGVRVLEVRKEVIDEVYSNRKLILSPTEDGRWLVPFDKRHILFANEFIVLKDIAGTTSSALTRVVASELRLIQIDKRCPISGVSPRNKEQHMALDVLMDDQVPVVVMTGRAGTGKTLLTLAVAMAKIEDGMFDRIILTRSMSWVGKHSLGALPGDVDEKFRPYLENYMCNIEHLVKSSRNKTQDIITQYKIDLVPIQLIRGASWHNTFVIADEVQTLDYHEMVTLGTRLGEGSKLVIMGDLGQRDENIPREKTGIYKVVNDFRAKVSPLIASIDLQKCERSATAALFADIFEV